MTNPNGRRKYEKFSDADVSQMRAEAQLGKSIQAIAKSYNTDRYYAARLIHHQKRANDLDPKIPLRKSGKLTPQDRDTIISAVLTKRRHFGSTPSARVLAKLVRKRRTVVTQALRRTARWIARLESRVNRGPVDSCWPWRGGYQRRKPEAGRGILPVPRFMDGPSRSVNPGVFLFTSANGPLPPRHRLERTCLRPDGVVNFECVNPHHGRLVKQGRRPAEEHA